MIHTYKITKANEWRNFKSIVIIIFGMLVGLPLVFYFDSSSDNFVDFFLDTSPFALIGFLLFFIPLVAIHIRYQTINEGMEMVYDDIEKRIVVKDMKNDKVLEFYLDDIKQVFHTMTPPFHEKRMEWVSWDSYNYSDIFLKDGRKVRITSLMVYRLVLPVGDRYEVVTSFYPYPRNG